MQNQTLGGYSFIHEQLRKNENLVIGQDAQYCGMIQPPVDTLALNKPIEEYLPSSTGRECGKMYRHMLRVVTFAKGIKMIDLPTSGYCNLSSCLQQHGAT